MKIEEGCWCSLLLLFILCPRALPEAVTGAGNGTNGSANIAWTTMGQATVAPIQLTTDGEAPSPPPQTAGIPAEKPYVAHRDLSGTGLGPYIRYQR